MLNKECCKKCHQNEYLGGWMKFDEQRWEIEGEVCCPLECPKKGESNIRITDKPPNKCPFYLEHVI